jgi:hypothetical protein
VTNATYLQLGLTAQRFVLWTTPTKHAVDMENALLQGALALAPPLTDFGVAIFAMRAFLVSQLSHARCDVQADRATCAMATVRVAKACVEQALATVQETGLLLTATPVRQATSGLTVLNRVLTAASREVVETGLSVTELATA